MKKRICALILCLSLPLSAAMPSFYVMTQGSFALSAICSMPTSISSVVFNDKAERAKEELNRALQNITCNSLNCTRLMVRDVKALGAMTNLQYNAWAASILQIIPDLALFIPIAFLPRTVPRSQNLATSLVALVWIQGLGTWISTMYYTRNTQAGIPSYCNNSCADYRPYLDSTKFTELQTRAEHANSPTTTAWKLSIAHGVVRMISLVIPVIIFGTQQHFCPPVEEGAPLYVQ